MVRPLLHCNSRQTLALLQNGDLESRSCSPAAPQPMMTSSLACSTTAPRSHTRGLGSYAVERRLPLVPADQTALANLPYEKDLAGLDGRGIPSPANKVFVPLSIPACCGYTQTLMYSSTAPIRSHVSQLSLEMPILLLCHVFLKTGKGYNSRLYSLLAKQVSHSRSNLLTWFCLTPPVFPYGPLQL